MPLDIARVKVLIVDDALHIRKIIKAVCGSMGITDIEEAPDGRAAMDHLKAKKLSNAKKGVKKNFDLIICDWMMPQICGLDLLKTVRKDPVLKRTAFLMVTAEQDRDLVMKAIEEGVNDYVIKPFTADILEAKIRKVLK